VARLHLLRLACVAHAPTGESGAAGA